jgi:hypothetical protein
MGVRSPFQRLRVSPAVLSARGANFAISKSTMPDLHWRAHVARADRHL